MLFIDIILWIWIDMPMKCRKFSHFFFLVHRRVHVNAFFKLSDGHFIRRILLGIGCASNHHQNNTINYECYVSEVKLDF